MPSQVAGKDAHNVPLATFDRSMPLCAVSRAAPETRNLESLCETSHLQISEFPRPDLQCADFCGTRSTHHAAGARRRRIVESKGKNAHEASTMLFVDALAGRLRDGRCVGQLDSGSSDAAITLAGQLLSKITVITDVPVIYHRNRNLAGSACREGAYVPR
jgi:hypothetical protein